MKKLARKILAVCLSAVMAGTLLSATAFAAKTDDNGISLLASGVNAVVVDIDQTWEDCEIIGDVYIQKDVTLKLEGITSVDGDVYVFGTLMNNKALAVSGTLHCLHYISDDEEQSAGEYDYGYFYNGSEAALSAGTVDVSDGYLDTEIPDTGDRGESGDSYITCIGVPVSITLTRNISISEEFEFISSDGAEVSAVQTGISIIADSSGVHYGYMFSVTMEETGSHKITATGLTTGASISFTLDVNPHDMVLQPYQAPTCTEDGHEEYYKCSVCGRMTSDAEGEDEITWESVEIAALGHTWEKEVEWSWSEDHRSATASRTCSACGETETVTATVTGEITVEPTETEDGVIVYTATATFDDGTTVTDSVTDVYTLEDKEKDESDGNSGISGATGGTNGTGSTGSGNSGSSGSGNSGSSSSGNSGSSSSGNSGSGSNGSYVTSPQTGDPVDVTALWLIVACFVLAGCAAFILYKVRRMEEQN